MPARVPSAAVLAALAVAALAAPALHAQPALADPPAAGASATTAALLAGMPALPREFRAIWVASVGNLDWPSRPGLSSQEQQQELVAILDRAAALRMNAVILQVRPAADALYRSEIEPWSEYLTGTQGQAPDPAYDPLAFAIEEAHARGLELHAWFNPYRARMEGAKSAPARNHISVRRPELVRRYGAYLWMDPGEPAVREYSTRVIMDVVRRYDVDGIHIDDYFYPYREQDARGREMDFPDAASWRKYRRQGGRLSRGDWRRRNVDLFVEGLYRRIKDEKPRVKFGISPFGIWRPGSPAGVAGLDAYVELFADSRKWIRNGWADYFTPQLYWATDRPQQSYVGLQRWWGEQNQKGRHLWIGNYTSRVGGDYGVLWHAGELVEQIRLTRADPATSGNVHFSARALMTNKEGLSDWLETIVYAEPALVPASPWLDRTPPAPPTVAAARDTTDGGLTLALAATGKERPWLWTVRARYGDEWRTEIVPGQAREHHLAPLGVHERPDVIVVNAIDRVGNASAERVVR